MRELHQFRQALQWSKLNLRSDDGRKFFRLFMQSHMTPQASAVLYEQIIHPKEKKADPIVGKPLRFSSKVDAWLQKAKSFHNPTLKGMHYADFLETEYWKCVRNAKLEDGNHKCESCNQRDKLEVHHLTYEHRGSDHKHMDSMMVLCSKCHRRRHPDKN